MKEEVLHGVFRVLTVFELAQQEREQACPVGAHELGECLLVPVPRTFDELGCRLGSKAVDHHSSRTPHGRNYCVRGDVCVLPVKDETAANRTTARAIAYAEPWLALRRIQILRRLSSASTFIEIPLSTRLEAQCARSHRCSPCFYRS